PASAGTGAEAGDAAHRQSPAAVPPGPRRPPHTGGSLARAGERDGSDYRTCRGRLPSSLSRNSLVGRPPPKPVSAPLAPITRWQGSTIGSGLRPLAAPTAREAAGLPTRAASWP